jgi:hypothetical protein
MASERIGTPKQCRRVQMTKIIALNSFRSQIAPDRPAQEEADFGDDRRWCEELWRQVFPSHLLSRVLVGCTTLENGETQIALTNFH